MKISLKKILIILFWATFIWSTIPMALIYLKKEPAPVTNEQAIAKLQDNEGDLFGFVVYGDPHTGIYMTDSMHYRVIQHVNLEGRWKKLDIDFVAITGDLTFRGSAWDYKVFNKLRDKVKWPVISVIGNHDDDKESGKGMFEKYIGSKNFSFVNRNSYFIGVDNNTGDISEEQFEWLEDELKKSQKYDARFLFMHKSPISGTFRHFYRQEMNDWSRKLTKMCEKYNVDIVFAGHEHFYSENTFGGVKYITTGGAGMPLDVPRWEGGYSHYVVVRVNRDYVDYEVRQVFPPFWRFVIVTVWQDAFYLIRDAFFR